MRKQWVVFVAMMVLLELCVWTAEGLGDFETDDWRLDYFQALMVVKSASEVEANLTVAGKPVPFRFRNVDGTRFRFRTLANIFVPPGMTFELLPDEVGEKRIFSSEVVPADKEGVLYGGVLAARGPELEAGLSENWWPTAVTFGLVVVALMWL